MLFKEHLRCWSPVLFRVMEGITGCLLPGGLLVLLILILSYHFNHLFIWMDPEVVEHDKIIKAKSGYLDPYFFLIKVLSIWWLVSTDIFQKILINQDNSTIIKTT